MPPGQVPPPGPFGVQPWQPQYGVAPTTPGQQLPHGLGWGAPAGGPQPPKKGGGAAKAILFVVGGLVGVVILLSLVSGYLKHNSSSADSPYYVPTTDPSYSPTYDPTSYESPTSAPSQPTTAPTTTEPTSTRPTVTRPTAPRTSSTPPVKRGPTAYEWVSRNKLYSTGVMASVGCKESRARPSTVAGATANYLQLRSCLSRAWSPYVKRAGGSFRVPNLQTFTGTVQSPCGSMSDTGPPFYCGDNDTIYMNLSQDVGNYNRYTQSYSKVWARMWMLHQFAHEFGHHVQNMTGILQANHDLRYDAPNRTVELEMTRRLELQASCFSDVFIGANKRSYPITGQSYVQWKWLIANTTDYGNDHGDADIHNYWALRGFNSRNPGACNTFTAPSGKVR
ncbi:neutral zinc metallopeptidase [Kribbella monticola]|uniref:neutral zinc metallopeptidase n=1 Tax=Kribbella monticola TaxID=2185285 RepID=UPI000DD4E132|nr:neutral zinc metallopeptidase [Kribbella monticola]